MYIDSFSWQQKTCILINLKVFQYYLEHSNIIRRLTSEPQIGSRQLIRGTFAYWFPPIRGEIRGNKRTVSIRIKERWRVKVEPWVEGVVAWEWEEQEKRMESEETETESGW